MTTGDDPPRQRWNRVRRSSSSDSMVRLRSLRRSRSPSPATKKRMNGHYPYWLLAVAVAFLLPTPRNLPASLPPANETLFGYSGLDTKVAVDVPEMFFTPDYSDEHFFDAFKNMRPMGIRWRDDSNFFKRSPRTEVTVMPVLTERRPLIEHHRAPPVALPSSSRLSEEPSLEDIELIDVLWRSDLSGQQEQAEKGGPSEQYERDLQTLTEKSVRAPLSREDASRYEQLSKGYFEDFYGASGPHSQAASQHAAQSPSKDRLYAEPSVASCSSPVSPSVSQSKPDLPTPTDAELEALFDEMLYKDGTLEHLGFSGQQPHLLNNVSLGVPYGPGNLTDVVPVVAPFLNTSCSDGSQGTQHMPPPSFNTTNFWHNHTEGPLPGYLRADGINNLTMAVQHMSHAEPTLTEIGVLPPYAQTTQSSTTNLSVPARTNNLAGLYDPYYGRRSISISNESSIESSTSSSSTSPRYGSETENHSPIQSRYYGKLLPNLSEDQEQKYFYAGDEKNVLRNVAPFISGTTAPRRRGRQSKDEQLAAAFGLPVSAAEIADMCLPDLQKMLRSDELSDEQKTLIRKIRRRGKNKVAARTCRMRRGEVRPPAVAGGHLQWGEPARTLYRRQ